MSWTIRQQILVPILSIQTLAVAAITLASVVLVERRVEREIEGRLDGLVKVLGSSNFPLTSATLARMQGLTGARFIAYGTDQRPLSASEPGLMELPREATPPSGMDAVSRQEAISNLYDSPAIRIDGQDHLAALVALRASGPGQPLNLLVLYPETSWREARWAAALPPLCLGTGALGLMAAATTAIAHRFSSRVRRLERGVARIAEGDFQDLPRGPGPRSDEIHDLEASINRMCGELRRMSGTIRAAEREQLLAQLAAGLSHQLRNALTGARLSIQLHARRCEQARSEPSMDVALRQLSLIEEQVRGLLSLGQADRRPRRGADLGTLVTDVALLLRPTCEHVGVMLQVQAAPSPAVATIDEPGVRAAVLNLGLNGIEAAGAGGTTRLEILSDSECWSIQVSDNGPGPPAAIGDFLFDPFVSGKPEGIGLGLALARQVAEAHDGSLTWSREDGWTRFQLRLPKGINPKESDREHGPGSHH